jgi:hypothetical protein
VAAEGAEGWWPDAVDEVFHPQTARVQDDNVFFVEADWANDGEDSSGDEGADCGGRRS